MAGLILLPIMLLATYFFLIRPQAGRVKKHQAFLLTLEVGDRVVTSAGIIGEIVDLNDTEVILDCGDGVELTFVRPAISQRVDAYVDIAGVEDRQHEDSLDGPGGEDR